MPMPTMPHEMGDAGFRKMSGYGSGTELREKMGKGPMMKMPSMTGAVMGKMEERMSEFLTEGLSETDVAKVKSILDSHKESMAAFVEKVKAVTSMEDGDEKKAAMEALKSEMDESREALKKELSALVSEDKLSSFDKEHSMKMGGGNGFGRERREGSGSTMGRGDREGNSMGMNRGKDSSERQYGATDRKLYEKVGTLLDAKVAKMSETEAKSYLERIVSKIDALLSSGQSVKDSVRKKLVVIKESVEDKLAETAVDLGSILE